MSTNDTLGRGAAHEKRHGLLWAIAAVAALVLLIPLLVLGWLGFVPGLSSMMGASAPRDLGVQYTPADVQSYRDKWGVKVEDVAAAPENPAKPGRKPVFADPRRVETSFTQEELSAAINNASLAWLPLKDVQLKLGDHSVELSGLLSTDRIAEFLKMAARLGFNQADLARAADYAAKLTDAVPVYIKAAGGVQDSRIDLDVQEVSIGRFTVSPEVLARVSKGGIHKPIKASESFAVQTAMPQNGSLSFAGVLPTTVYLKNN